MNLHWQGAPAEALGAVQFLCKLGRKVHIFREIKYFERPEFSNRYDKLDDELFKILTMRDTVAHAYQTNFLLPVIRKKIDSNDETLDDEYVKKFNESYGLCGVSLFELIDALRKERLEKHNLK